MVDKTIITTTKRIYPQIYAYVTPNYKPNEGWVKIGYTDRQNVKTRIAEQTKTAGIEYDLLWCAPAKFSKTKDINDWFKDKEFHAYLRQFKQVKQRLPYEWFYYNGAPEKSRHDFNDFLNHQHSQIKEQITYKLRQEQLEAIEQTLKYIENNADGEFLWNAKPRFGKTLATYDLARKMNAYKVLILTNRPAIANSWFDDFEKFIAWQTDYAFVSTSDSLKERPVLTREQFLNQTLNGKKRMIAFISLQDLKGSLYFSHDGLYDKLKWVKETSWDLLVIDEAHEGVDTNKAKIAFDLIQTKFILHLSGTPFKALADGKFGADEIYNWTYADEQSAKVKWVDSEEQNPYEKLPRLNLFSYQMSSMITEEVNKGANIEGENHDYAFDLNEFFLTNDGGKFIHEADIKKWLDALTHNHKYPFSTKELRDEMKHTFWLLNRVSSAKALQKLLQKHPVFKDYEIVLAAGDGRGEDDEQVITQHALDKVKKAVKEHDKTITLSVGQLTTGITVPEWTGVLMLSNLKSPSLYMQAAFRAQNPWEYEVDGDVRQKQNAYVFDFAPERTLTIYEDFANNLSKGTSGGSGTTEDRKKNIKQLLNFFPVIAEDGDGKMIELDVNQVLTLPKVFKAKEVVRRGFMSNFLFQNVSGIFASEKAREILEQLNPVDVGKSVPRKTDEPIDTQGVSVDEQGKSTVDNDIVVSTTDANFGEKVYGDISKVVEKATKDVDGDTLETPTGSMANVVSSAFKENIQEAVQDLAKEQGLTAKFADQVTNRSAQEISKEIEIVQKHTEIKQKEAEIEHERHIAQVESQAVSDETKRLEIEKAKSAYEVKQQEIAEAFKEQIKETVDAKSKELVQQTTQAILEKAEEKKKNTIEDDVRARLRGFARTIPSFLMAYGVVDTTLANFDTTIKDEVFKEVTGITLGQFRILRDEFNFFDESVFNQSVQEFLNKRRELANYFDDNQEDIFDYIPPQETNQIFTPKWVVKMMIDKLEEQYPYLFKQSDKTFADLYVKSGLYLTEIVKRLYVGLADEIPDQNARLKHILEHQIYGFAPSEIILNISRNFVFGFDEEAKKIDQSHIVLLDTTPYAKGLCDVSFEEKCNELFKKNR